MDNQIPDPNVLVDQLKDQVANLTHQLAEMRIYTGEIMEATNEPILILDKDLNVQTATKGFYNTFNITEHATMGQYFDNLKKCPWNNPGLVDKLVHIINHASSFSDYEMTCILPGDEKRTFNVSGRYLETWQDKQLIIVTIDEVTANYEEQNKWGESKKLFEERMKEERMKLAVESADMGIWEMDPNKGKIIWDKRCQELFGITETVTGFKEFLTALHPDDRNKTEATVTEVIEGTNNGKYNMEYRTGFKNENQMRWLKANGRAYFDSTGKAIRFAGTVMDITRQKLNEGLLRESEERFRLASDAAAVLLWLAGTDKLHNYFNKSWLQFTGKALEEEQGNGWCKGIHPDDVERCLAIYERSFEAREEFHMEYRLRRHDGKYRWIKDSGAPRFSPDNIFEGYVGTCMDIHDQKMTREELEKVVADRTRLLSDAVFSLETSNRNLEEFAYVASHDLQEPLRKIQTFANRLQEKSSEYLSEDTKLYLSKITKASERMSRLIGDLLSYSRLQKTDHPVETIDLNDVLANVLIDFDMIIQEKKAAINVEKLPSIKAVPTRMNQLFHNLLSNALKFYQPGISPIIHIYAAAVPDEIRQKYPLLKSAHDYTMLTFADNGIGFNEEFAEKIFNIFQRLNGVGEYEGTGIGLAICRKIVNNQNGVIFAESKENEGTSFHVILPVD